MEGHITSDSLFWAGTGQMGGQSGGDFLYAPWYIVIVNHINALPNQKWKEKHITIE